MTAYRWNPADYNQNSSMQAKFAADLLDRLDLRGNERVLDIGCGDGKITAALARRLPLGSVVGIDLSPEMVAFARKNFPPVDHPNLAFQVADASRLPFADEFDWVVSFAALHWICNHEPVLLSIARALIPGGHVLMQFGGQGNGGPLFDLAHMIIDTDRWRAYFRHFEFPWQFYPADDYARLVRAAGLAPDRIELVLREAAHQGREGFGGWMRSTWVPYLQFLPADLWEPFIADVIDRYIAVRPMDADGVVRVPMMRLEVECHKP